MAESPSLPEGWEDEVDALHREVGRLVVTSAGVEYGLMLTISLLLHPEDPDARDDEVERLHGAHLRDLVDACRPLVRSSPLPYDDLRDRLEALLDECHEIAPRRNRVIHDNWGYSLSEEADRLTLTRVVTARRTAPGVLQSMSVMEVQDLANDMTTLHHFAWGHLGKLRELAGY